MHLPGDPNRAHRAVRRDPSTFPTGPGDLVEWVDDHMEPAQGVKTGRYAGPLTRLLAVMLDSLIVTLGLTLLAAGVVFVVRLFVPEFEIPEGSGVWYGVGLSAGAFSYLWASYAVFGKTLGKMVLGVRVVSSDASSSPRCSVGWFRRPTPKASPTPFDRRRHSHRLDIMNSRIEIIRFGALCPGRVSDVYAGAFVAAAGGMS
jgi:hypothetical protein